MDRPIVHSRPVGWVVLLALFSTLASCPGACWVLKFPSTTTVSCDRAAGTCTAAQAYPLGDEVRVERIDGMGSVQIRASRGGKSRGDSWPYHIHPNRQPGGDVRWIGNIMSMGEARRFQAEIDAFLGDPAKASARFELDQTAAVFPAWLIFGAALLGWLGTRFTRIRSTLRMKGTNLLLTLESPWSTPVSREFLPGQVLGVVVETSRTMARVWLELAGGQQQHHVGAAPMAVAEEWAERLGGWLGVSVRRQAAPEAARKENPTGS